MRVRVRRDLAIKKLLKIFLFNFLYIFTIKIFLKNTLLCLDSQKKKKKKKKASFGFSGHFQGRFHPFPASFGRFRPVSAISAAGQYDPIWPIRPDFGRISPVRRKSKPIWHESSRIGANRAASARIEPHRRESEKKKKTQTRTDAWATASNASAAPLVPRPCFLDQK